MRGENALTRRYRVTEDPSATALFLGERSGTADLQALGVAKAMALDGVDADEIWRQTGWAEDPAGNWFYETDDRAFKLGEKNHGPWNKVFSHPELERAYGDRLTPVVGGNSLLGGLAERQGFKGAFISPRDGGAGNRAFYMAPNLSPDMRRTVGLHESQHMVDDLEGVLQTDPMPVRPTDPISRRSYFQKREEVRARNVERRREMTPEQRRQHPPWETEDVPPWMLDIGYVPGSELVYGRPRYRTYRD